MFFAGLGERDEGGNWGWDWPGVGHRAGAAGQAGAVDGPADELDVLFVLGGYMASNMPLLTSSSMVSIAEVFPIRSVTPI